MSKSKLFQQKHREISRVNTNAYEIKIFCGCMQLDHKYNIHKKKIILALYKFNKFKISKIVAQKF